MATYKKINQLEEAAKRLNTAGTELGNMTYDNFKAGNVYKGLQRDYQQGGQMAMKDTLGQVAARTGGMASSYATSAANQSYNNYMKGLEDAARSLFNDEYSRAKDKYNTARDEYSTAYGEYRDAIGDERYDKEWNYQVGRDQVADERYDKEWNYQVGRDQLEDERYNDTQKKKAAETQKGELYNLIISGGTPNRADFPDLTDADWNTITATATNTYNSTNKEDYLASVRESAAAGMLPVFDPNNKWGVTIDEFKNELALGEADYKNSAGYLSNQKATDDSIRSMLTSEGFDWDAYDWNGDAEEGLGSPEDYFAGKGSAYDSGYWQGIYNDAQKGYADADTKAAQDEVIEILEAGGEPPIDLLINAGWLEEIIPANEGETPNYDSDGNGIPDGLSGLAATMWQNNIDAEGKTAAVNDIEARIANGESLESIAEAYGIGNDADWKAVTGKSLAEWTKKFNDNTAKNYSYQDTEAGRAEIVGKLIDSGTLSLSAKDQSNFDYIFGTGAYTEVKRLIDNIGAVQLDGADTINTQTNAYIDDEVEAIANRFPTFSSEQIYALLEKANPDVFRVWADEMVRD